MHYGLFISCLTETFYPRSGVALVKILEHLGHTIAFPEAQTCCGQPMYNNGLRDEAAALARRMIRVFEPYERVVTPSGSCASMVREHFATLFEPGSGDHASALALAARTREFVEVLVGDLNLDLRTLGARRTASVTYHYSCHLRGLGVTDEVVRLLRQIDGIDYRPLERIDQCCGFGGTFAIKYPTISGGMVGEKIDCIAKTGADLVVCNDAGCAMNIEGAARRSGATFRVITVAELIAESLGLLEVGR